MCGRAMKKNGRTGKGVQRWKCPACRLSSTMPQRRRRRERTLEEFLSWLLGPSSQRAADPAGDARALRKRIAWCWRIRPRIAPPDARRHTVMADGTYMGHGWCLDHRHRRANRRGAGPAVVRARVQGRIPGPVLPASRAGRAHHRRAARRGGGVHAGVAGNEDPALPGARAAQREDGPDVQARAPGRPRARGCPTGSPRSGRPGGPSGGARPSTHGTNGGRTSSPNAPTRATTRPTPRRRGTGGGGRTRSCDAATGGWRGCSARAGCSPISSRNC